MENFEDKEISRLYRDFIKSELTAAEVQRDKRLFIRRNFMPSSGFDLRPAVFIPAMSLCLVAALIFVLMPEQARLPVKAPVARQTESASGPALPTYREALEMSFDDVPVLKHGSHQIEVTRLTSQVGNTMFYQSVEKDVPLTVVWVFPKSVETVMQS